MSVYNIGKFIKTRRNEMGITQQNLAEGICSPVTLSRIENGENPPTQKHIRALLQRLGYSDAPIMFMTDQVEADITRLQFEISSALTQKAYDKALPLLVSLGKLNKHFSNMDKLFYEVTSAVLDVRINSLPRDVAIKRLEGALMLTHPRYSPQKLPLTLTHIEAIALNNIAICHYSLGNFEDAIRYYKHIQRFYEDVIQDPEEVKRLLPTIYYNLSKILGLLGRYDECIYICDQGILYARKVQRFAIMPETLYNKAWSMIRRNGPGDLDAAKQAATSASVLLQIYETHPELLPLLEKMFSEYFGEEMPRIQKSNSLKSPSQFGESPLPTPVSGSSGIG